jgi:putative ABC transport system permease protein
MKLHGIHEGIGIALAALRQNKIRAGLTVLGVTIGVFVVMVIAAVVQGINHSFEEIIEAAGPRTFYVVRTEPELQVSTGLEEEPSEFFRRPVFQPEYADALEVLPAVQHAYPFADLGWLSMRAEAGRNRVQVAIQALPVTWLRSDLGEVTEGRWYTNEEDRAGRPVIVVDSATAKELFAPAGAVGRNVRIGQQLFRVIGVYDPPPNLFAQGAKFVYMPFGTARKHISIRSRWFTFDHFVGFVVIGMPDVSLEVAMDQVTGRMRALRRLRPGQKNDFAILTQDQILELWGRLTTGIFAVMVALSAAGLLVGGVGVVAVMVVAVTERTREIGIRKAMGANRRDILWQFLVEAATLTGVGGICGLVFGGLLVWVLGRFTPIPASVPGWAIAAALVASALTGIVFGLFPALRASRLDPVASLRYE